VRCTGVDSDAVTTKDDIGNDIVSVYHDHTVIRFRIEKRFADPQLIAFALLFQRNSRPDSRMYEEVVAFPVVDRQALKKRYV